MPSHPFRSTTLAETDSDRSARIAATPPTAERIEAGWVAFHTRALWSPEPGARLTLRSLAPEYLPDHSGYFQHLEDAIEDRENRNIALTGRNGSGKSSVLDEFERSHLRKTLRICISTLGPDEDDEDLTNRIQKELVEQLR